MKRTRIVATALALAALAAPCAASADHRELLQVSRGQTAGNSSNYVTWGTVLPDGTAFFSSADALLPEDTDGQSDVYEDSNGKLTLISVPEAGTPPGTPQSAGFARASADGSTVVFSTTEQMTPDDDDGGSGDWFARRDGHTYLVSKPDPNAFILLSGTPLAGQVSDDGKHVFFTSIEDLVPEDSNFTTDLYDWSFDTKQAKPVSVDENGNTGAHGAGLNVVAVASGDGTRAFFVSRDQMTSDDTDSFADVYMRENGVTTLVTKATSADPQDVTLRQVSKDGRHVFIQTTEQLVPEDTDTEIDVYDVVPGSDPVLVSTGTQTGQTSYNADFQRASDDGSRVWFTTQEQLLPDDTDDNQDIYLRTGGATTLETVGPTGGNTGFDDIIFSGILPDGSRMYFTTHEALTADDQDFSVDIYERHDGQTRRVSVTDPAFDNGFGDANFAAASQDGSRIIFQSQDQMLAGDVDNNDDLYEWDGTKTVQLTGGAQNVDAIWGGASADATQVFFTSTEQLTSFDTDDQADLFVSRLNASPSLATGPTTEFTAGSDPQPAAPELVIVDPDTDAFTGATATLSGAIDSGERLAFGAANGISATSSDGGKTLTLTGGASRADYEVALRSIAYGGGTSLGTRTVTFTLTDGFDTSAPVPQSIEVKAAPASSQTPQGQPPSGSPAQSKLASPTAEVAFVRNGQIEVPCDVDQGTLESCSAEAFMSSTAAKVIEVGSGVGRVAGRTGVVTLKFTPAGMKRLRARHRSTVIRIQITARVLGEAKPLVAQRYVRVLVPGTLISGRLGVKRLALELRAATVVRCEAPSRTQAKRLCTALRRAGVKAKLVPRRHGTHTLLRVVS